MATYAVLPLFPDAFIADTLDLDMRETGAYLTLLMMAWRSPECRLPDDDRALAKFLRMTPRAWCKLKPRVMRFWTLSEGYWTQKRLLKEYAFVQSKRGQAAINGRKGGIAKSLKYNKVGLADGVATPLTLTKKEARARRAKVFVGFRTAEWEAWRKAGKAHHHIFSQEHGCEGWWFPSSRPKPAKSAKGAGNGHNRSA